MHLWSIVNGIIGSGSNPRAFPIGVHRHLAT